MAWLIQKVIRIGFLHLSGVTPTGKMLIWTLLILLVCQVAGGFVRLILKQHWKKGLVQNHLKNVGLDDSTVITRPGPYPIKKLA